MQTIDFPLPLLIGGIIGGALGAAATAIFHLLIMPSVTSGSRRKNASRYTPRFEAAAGTGRQLGFRLMH